MLKIFEVITSVLRESKVTILVSESTSAQQSVEDNYTQPANILTRQQQRLRFSQRLLDTSVIIFASSAQTEKDLSSVGLTVTDARSSLYAWKDEKLELIRWGCRASIIHKILIKSNLHSLWNSD
ncbi:hypothetical protein HELRODRAFT_162939 [Helobdella robusta]|uniref:Uncharacterized protein n=1 Tax=Helobdella robusta TaxID=6412 RepID=T1ETE1_HELRO|nr:hypothetical protein HELRODRAFT_162939 [Helobdella robusta]ESN99392.1 hypothetical protein HELRODRAFT_162939 [Helobdella robusta]